MGVRSPGVWLAIFCCAVLTACGGGGGGGSPPPPPPQSQTITFAQPGPLSGAVGTSLADLASGGAGTGAITYGSGNTAVASVDATTGTVTLLTAGSTSITATKAASTGFNSATANYTVNVTPGAQTIAFAQSGPLNALLGSVTNNVASGGGGTGAVSYASSNTDAVTVDPASGAATAVGVGAATITGLKASDVNFTQAQTTYTINVQTANKVSAWIGAQATDVNMPASANGKQFGRARVSDCSIAGAVATCSLAELDPVNGTSISDTRATLTTPAYYAITNGASLATTTTIGTPIIASATRFAERIGHATAFFAGRYWVIGGAVPGVTGATPMPSTAMADVWSSADGKSWKLETADGGFGARWFHQVVVFQNRLWIISGAPNPVTVGLPYMTDVWSSADGVTWRQETANAQLPWWSTTINVVVWNNQMLAVSGGRTYSSTTGVFSEMSATPNSIVVTNTSAGRANASLTIYNGKLWYIGGVLAYPIGVTQIGSAMNDVWVSTDGIAWTQTTAAAPFSPRYEHTAFVANNKLWVLGGQGHVAGVDGDPAADEWSTTDGITWTLEHTSGLARSFAASVVQETAPSRATLIGGIQIGYSNNVWPTTNGTDWAEQSTHAQFSSGMPTGLEFNGRLWIVGGSAIDGTVNGMVSNAIWRSSDGLNWSRVTTSGTIFSPRTGHTVTAFNNQLWVIGGYDNPANVGGTATPLNDIWSSSDGVTWTQHAPAAGTVFSPRAGHGSTVFGGKLWVVGGWGGSASGDLNDVWFSGDGTTWVSATINAAFSARSTHRLVTFNNAMWLIAGGTVTGLGDVWSSTDGVAWTKAQPVGQTFPARTWHSVQVLNGRMYVVAGVSDTNYDTGVRYNDVWSSADGVSWRQETAAAPFAPRGLASVIAHNNELWLIGGFGFGAFNDVWRSADGANWRLGFSEDIVAP
ncbi:MAG TPA: kelch repeat-containing protein [Steroidobacteraceae bacterium]|nr:kelch repeat-containing protein [Steroidobacteraceae bacterium]